MGGAGGRGYATYPPNRTDTQYKLTAPTHNTSLPHRHTIQAYRIDTQYKLTVPTQYKLTVPTHKTSLPYRHKTSLPHRARFRSHTRSNRVCRKSINPKSCQTVNKKPWVSYYIFF